MFRRVTLLPSLVYSQLLLFQNPSPSSLHALAGAGGVAPSPPLRSDDRRLFLSFSTPHRSFASSSASSSPEPSRVRLLDSAEKVNDAISKARDEKLPAVFYFTAGWCGPCKFISPTIEELSKKYPDVTTYKIDIDQEALGTILHQLHIYSVPTLHFYHDGKRAAEMIGADVERLKETMASLYN